MLENINLCFPCLSIVPTPTSCQCFLTLDQRLCSLTQEAALSFVLAFCRHPELRAGLGSAGAITMFIEKIQGEDLATQRKFPLISALCLCAHEAVNRVRIREAKGLELLLRLLDDDAYGLIHNRLISCLVCFLYDEPSFEVFLSNGLVPILLKHLVRVAKLDKHEESTLEADADLDETQDGKNQEEEEEKTHKEASEADKETAKVQQANQNVPESSSTPEGTSDAPSTSSDFKRSVSCPVLRTETPKTVTYSMDSPTYQEIPDFNLGDDRDYFTGPKNLVQAQQYFADVESSAPRGGMSPWSYSTGGSPYRSPTGSASPTSVHGLSPYRSPAAQAGPYSPLSVSSVASSHSPGVSPDTDRPGLGVGLVSPPPGTARSPAEDSAFSPGLTSTSAGSGSASARSLCSFSPAGSDAQAVPSSSQGSHPQWTPLSSPFHLDSPRVTGEKAKLECLRVQRFQMASLGRFLCTNAR